MAGPLLSQLPDSEGSRLPGSKVPSLSTAWSVDRTRHHVEAQRLQEATGQVGSPHPGALSSVQGWEPVASPVEPHGTILGRLILRSVHSPGKAVGGAPLFCALRQAQGAKSRPGLRPSGLHSWAPLTSPEGGAEAAGKAAASTVALILTMGSNFTCTASRARFPLNNLNCLSRNKGTILADEC